MLRLNASRFLRKLGPPEQKAAPIESAAPSELLSLDLKVGDTFELIGNDAVVCDILLGPRSSVYLVKFSMREVEGATAVIKALPLHSLHNEQAVERLKGEAIFWLQLGEHPNITRASMFVQNPKSAENGLPSAPYIVVEFIRGGNLRWRLRHGEPLPLEQTVAYATDFCRGMMHCSGVQSGFIHGDIKPENCLIRIDPRANPAGDPYGILAITDFGLSLAAGAVGSSPQFGGTLPYMAPELFRSRRSVDHRADIYAFGVMLFEMMTGRHPYQRPMDEMVDAHLHTAPTDPREFNPELPQNLRNLCLACLAKDPRKRPETFKEIYDAFTLNVGVKLQAREKVLATYIPPKEDEAIRLAHRAAGIESPNGRPTGLLIDPVFAQNPEHEVRFWDALAQITA